VVTDPPYAVSDIKTRYTIRDHATGQCRTRSGNFGQWDFFASPIEYRGWLLNAVNDLLRVLKPGGVLAVFCQDRLLSHLINHLEKGGHRLINTFVFRKKNPFPLLRKVGWQHALEFGVIAAKQGARHTFNNELGYQSNCLTAAVHYAKERLFGAHPSQKPEVIITPLLNYFSRPGDLVLDPFAGSGTTAVVAKRLGRHFVAIEQNHTFVQLAKHRLKALSAEIA
jgi:DNA modification methylase